MELVILVLIGLFAITFILAGIAVSRIHAPETADYTYVKPKVINEYTDDDVQRKKKIFEECLRKGMTPFDALLHCK